MAKLAVTVTLLFFFIAVSYARTPLDLPEEDIKPSIHHLTDKSEPITIVKSEEDLPMSETYTVDRVTVTSPAAAFVSFRPINRHFNVQRQFGLRLPLRRCRHHKKSMNLRYHGREVSYGNDMLLASDGSETNEIPARWVNFHHHHRHHDNDGLPEFRFDHHKFGKGKYQRQFKKAEEVENGLMKKIRKFLTHF